MPVYPGDPQVTFRPICWLPEAAYNVTQVTFGTHAGTHIDVPRHRLDDLRTVDLIDLETCVGPAEVLDLRNKGHNSEIDARDLERFADRIEPGCRLLLRTDWSKRFGQNDFLTEFPGISPAAAEWMVRRGVRLLGLEQPSVHRDKHQEVHSILLGAGVVLVETLANLSSLTQNTVWMVVLPLKLAGLDGSPARAIAFDSPSND